MILRRGAEAIIYLEGGRLVKERIKKGYRISEIDNELRKQRTKQEAKLLTESGVNAPKVFKVEGNKIVMEYLEGERVKELLDKTNTRGKLFIQIGSIIGKLHSKNIIHGDLTTSNMIFKNDVVYFIDFGLGFFSQRIEDKATDLRLLRQALKSTHHRFLNEAWESILIGYKKEYSSAPQVLERLKEVEKRGRYVKRNEAV